MSHDETISTCEAMAASFPGQGTIRSSSMPSARMTARLSTSPSSRSGDGIHLSGASWSLHASRRSARCSSACCEPASRSSRAAPSYTARAPSRARRTRCRRAAPGEESAASLVPVEGLMSAPCRGEVATHATIRTAHLAHVWLHRAIGQEATYVECMIDWSRLVDGTASACSRVALWNQAGGSRSAKIGRCCGSVVSVVLCARVRRNSK